MDAERAAPEGIELVTALDDAAAPRNPACNRSVDGWEDVEMEMAIDVDVFRPSAMLDARLDEEFGSVVAGFLRPDADGEEIGYVDLEQMLLSESDEELLALIQREAASAAGGPLHRRVFAIRNGRIVTTEESADASRFPPKYILVHPASSSSSPLKRRSVYCRTFGERSQAFGFASCSTVPSTSVAKVAPSVPTEDEDIEMNEEPEAVSTPLPSAGSPFAVAWNSAESVDPVVIKQEVVETQLSQTVDAPVTPIRPTPIARPVPVGNEEMLRTPLRRSMSSPVAAGWASPPVSANSFVSLDRMLTPSQADTESLALEPTQYRSMSPADEFEKVSALHSKGSLGRVDRLEWKISSRREINEDGRQSPGEAALPPRYFKGPSDAPEKRRVHSSTFSSFARSFSFTNGSASPSHEV